jgi:hypothetical protein
VIVYRCDHCGEPIGERLRIATNTYGSREEHFCSVPCVTEWGRFTGYYKPPEPGVVEAWIYCGATHPERSSDCKFVAGHTGTHMTHGGLEW